ncbi:leucine-rich repeat-containing protein 37A-like [Passer domesticus]|uniref:leucine-rich repeat-containing protein 37A-like n=1 Tax=Passer domesticus TaxID=48849 RepID=UPI0030FF097A
MDLVPRLVRALLLLALLLAVAPSAGVAEELCPEPCRCPGHGRLNCRHTGLATVPPASRRRALALLDFTGNSITALGKQAWKDYPWAETLVLRDNELRTVKSHSLEGLFLLKHLNLSGNGLTRIRSGTFQAWHGMQFLQELILSQNPLVVIDDSAFFKLPSVRSLDLSATQVIPQTLLQLLQTTVSLETLQVPKETACCLCQERPRPESPCRTIQFLCEKLCSSSAPQCVHSTVLQTRGEVMDMEQRRELNTSPVLILKPMEPSLGDHGTATLVVALTQSAEGGVSSLDSSRRNSYPPQHLLGHEGKTSAGDLRAKVKKKLHKAESIKAARITVPHQPQPARLKHVVEKTPSSWHQEKMESRLYWQGLKPSAVTGGLKHADDPSISGQHRDEEEDPTARKYHVRTHKRHKKKDRQYWVGHNPLFYQVLSPVKVERRSRSAQGLNRDVDFLSDPLVQSHPAVSSRRGATAEEKHSSIGGHLLLMPDTREEEDSMLLHKPVRPRSADLAPVLKDLETNADHHQQLMEAHKGLKTFMAHVERALRRDCSLPQLKQACAKMVKKTRLLLKVLQGRQENQEAYDPIEQCRQQENMIIHMALGKDKGLTGKHKQKVVVYVITFVVLLFFFVLVLLILKCVFHKRSRQSELDSQPGHPRKLWLRRFCAKLPQRGRKDNKEAQNVEQPLLYRAESSSECCPCSQAVHGASQCCSLFSKSELPWIQRIRDAYESQR